MENEAFFESVLNQGPGPEIHLTSHQPVGGGCINTCFALDTSKGKYFLKCNVQARADMFAKEYKGLAALRAQSPLGVPIAWGQGVIDDRSYLLMEFVSSGHQGNAYWEELGTGLAALHQNTYHRYGWAEDNYIGRLDQENSWNKDWIQFFIYHRLKPQINLAGASELLTNHQQSQFERLFNMLPDILYSNQPALLHGDLWSGNVMADHQGNPCIYDPAVYYGNPEIELAFTQLFGGFDKRFYESYHAVTPLVSEYQTRFDIYNLYPLLVHLNLFGTGYLNDIARTLNRVV